MAEEEWLECSECGYRNEIKSLDARSENKCPSCGARGGLQQVEKEEDELVEIENLPYKIPKKKYLEIFDSADLSDDLIEMLQGDRPVTQSDVERLERRIEESGKREELLKAQTKTAEIKGEALEEAFDRVKKRRPWEKLDTALEEHGAYDNLVGLGMKVAGKKLQEVSNFSIGEFLADLPSEQRREIMRDFLAVSSGEASGSPQSQKRSATTSQPSEPWENSLLDEEDWMELKRRMKVIYDEDMTQEELESELVDQLISITWNNLSKYEFVLGMSLAESLGIADEVKSLPPGGRWARIIEKAVDRGFEEGWLEEVIEDQADQFEEVREVIDECKKRGILEDVVRTGLLNHVDKKLHPKEAR